MPIASFLHWLSKNEWELRTHYYDAFPGWNWIVFQGIWASIHSCWHFCSGNCSRLICRSPKKNCPFIVELYKSWYCSYSCESIPKKNTAQNQHQWQSKHGFRWVFLRILFTKIGFIGNGPNNAATQENEVQPCNFRFENHSVTSLRGRIISTESCPYRYTIGK